MKRSAASLPDPAGPGRSTAGAVYVEFLIAFFPLFFFFLALVQFIFLETAHLITKHAAVKAVRAAAVVLADDPKYYGKVPVGSFTGARKIDIERAARVPLSALEFRPEFDRIPSTQVLELIQSVPSEQAHRLVALTFLSLFRMLRYLRLLDSIAIDHSERRVAGRAYLVLAVLRSDARALSNYLRRRAGAGLRLSAPTAA